MQMPDVPPGVDPYDYMRLELAVDKPYNTSMCPDEDPSAAEWTTAQATDGEGPCQICTRWTLRRLEPFSELSACKGCWEQIVYGEE